MLARKKTFFLNVPRPHVYENPPAEYTCVMCKTVIEHPIRVNTCDDKLCAPCWQQSCYNLHGYTNECLKCKKPTELVCYRDYWKFMAKNILEHKCWIEFSKKLDIDALIMFCNVEGCQFKGARRDVMAHERECWGEYHRKKLENEMAKRTGEKIDQPSPSKKDNIN